MARDEAIRCAVYRSARRQGLYLYVVPEEGFSRGPAELLEAFGRADHVMDLVLTPGRRLAREDTRRVMRNLKERGYHVQIPPSEPSP
jgi:uncharacterized protein YcgL (UPF0745 family)